MHGQHCATPIGAIFIEDKPKQDNGTVSRIGIAAAVLKTEGS